MFLTTVSKESVGKIDGKDQRDVMSKVSVHKVFRILVQPLKITEDSNGEQTKQDNEYHLVKNIIISWGETGLVRWIW